ncbi:MAG: CRISPR-associated protein Csx18 [Crocosphaera sp.]
MFISKRAAFVRNVAASAINCVITLILLLIAPLGLAAVITNTFLVTLSTFIICTLCDLIVVWLSVSPPPKQVINQSSNISRWSKSQEINRKRVDEE